MPLYKSVNKNSFFSLSQLIYEMITVFSIPIKQYLNNQIRIFVFHKNNTFTHKKEYSEQWFISKYSSLLNYNIDYDLG